MSRALYASLWQRLMLSASHHRAYPELIAELLTNGEADATAQCLQRVDCSVIEKSALMELVSALQSKGELSTCLSEITNEVVSHAIRRCCTDPLSCWSTISICRSPQQQLQLAQQLSGWLFRHSYDPFPSSAAAAMELNTLAMLLERLLPVENEVGVVSIEQSSLFYSRHRVMFAIRKVQGHLQESAGPGAAPRVVPRKGHSMGSVCSAPTIDGEQFTKSLDTLMECFTCKHALYMDFEVTRCIEGARRRLLRPGASLPISYLRAALPVD